MIAPWPLPLPTLAPPLLSPPATKNGGGGGAARPRPPLFFRRRGEAAPPALPADSGPGLQNLELWEGSLPCDTLPCGANPKQAGPRRAGRQRKTQGGARAREAAKRSRVSPHFFSLPSPPPPSLQVDDAMKAADALLAAANGGTAAPRSASNPASASAEAYPPPGMQLQCDVNGCSIVAVPHAARAPPPAAGVAGASFMSTVASMDSTDEDGSGYKGGRGGGGGPGASGGGPPRDFELAEGAGWRLGVDRSAPAGGPDYCAVVGGDGWSAALTRDEYDDLVKVRERERERVGWGDAGTQGREEAAPRSKPPSLHPFLTCSPISSLLSLSSAPARPAKVGGHPARVRGLAGIRRRRRRPGDVHRVRVGAGARAARARRRGQGGHGGRLL